MAACSDLRSGGSGLLHRLQARGRWEAFYHVVGHLSPSRLVDGAGLQDERDHHHQQGGYRADAGGEFEYCPGIRSPGNENYSAVRQVLDGERGPIRVLDLQVGDIQIFKGRFSLHRVAPTRGWRHTVIFGYDREPGYIGSVESTLRVYGRVMQAHIDADHIRHSDGLAD